MGQRSQGCQPGQSDGGEKDNVAYQAESSEYERDDSHGLGRRVGLVSANLVAYGKFVVGLVGLHYANDAEYTSDA